MLRSIRRQRAVVFIGVLALTAAGIELFAADAWTWLDVAADEPIDHAVMIRGPYEDAHRKTRLRGPVAVVTADGDAGPASPSDLVYPFYTTLTGSLGIVQDGLGTTSLQPLHGVNTFTGPVTVNLGTLATTGTAAALAGATSIAVNAGGRCCLARRTA
jgi:hypothetical protein